MFKEQYDSLKREQKDLVRRLELLSGHRMSKPRGTFLFHTVETKKEIAKVLGTSESNLGRYLVNFSEEDQPNKTKDIASFKRLIAKVDDEIMERCKRHNVPLPVTVSKKERLFLPVLIGAVLFMILGITAAINLNNQINANESLQSEIEDVKRNAALLRRGISPFQSIDEIDKHFYSIEDETDSLLCNFIQSQVEDVDRNFLPGEPVTETKQIEIAGEMIKIIETFLTQSRAKEFAKVHLVFTDKTIADYYDEFFPINELFMYDAEQLALMDKAPADSLYFDNGLWNSLQLIVNRKSSIESICDKMKIQTRNVRIYQNQKVFSSLSKNFDEYWKRHKKGLY